MHGGTWRDVPGMCPEQLVLGVSMHDRVAFLKWLFVGMMMKNRRIGT